MPVRLIVPAQPVVLMKPIAPMQISVVIPVHRDTEACARLLAELAPFRHQGFEVVVVESHESTTNLTLHSLADRWERSSTGRARQLQKGARVAAHSCLWFLHADSRDIAGAAEWLRTWSRRPDSTAGWGRFDVRFDDRRRLYRMVPWFMNWRSRLTAISTGDQGIFVDAALLRSVGGWPQQLLMEDVELCVRLRRLTRPSFPPRGEAKLTTSARRWRAHGVWRTIWLMWGLRLRYALGEDPEVLHRSYYGDNRCSDQAP